MALAVSIGTDTISMYVDGDYYQIDKSHANYPAVLEELRQTERDTAKLIQLMDVTTFVVLFTEGRLSFGQGEVRFKDEPLNGYMVDRVLQLAAEGLPVTSWARFMDNLMDNPLPSVRDDIYKWMEAGKLPITEDGCITAFKKVRADYTDVHSGKFSNKAGNVLEMDRSACNTDRNQTCSTGFHFCSAGYLSHFGGNKVMVVKINPRDVTAIPKDYNNHKARCCKYTVVGELKNESAARHEVWNKATVNLEDSRELPDVLLPRKGNPPSKVETDPERVTGPAPKDDLAVPGAAAPVAPTPPAAKAKKPSKPKKKAAATVEKDLPKTSEVVSAGAPLTFVNNQRPFTEAEVLSAYVAAGNSVAALSKALTVPKATLYGWLKKLGLK